MEKLTVAELVARYCVRQENTPDPLTAILRGQLSRYHCTGWFLAECQDLSSSLFGNYVILPYGPNNTFKEVPTVSFSPRGLASDMSVAVAYALASDLQASAPS